MCQLKCRYLHHVGIVVGAEGLICENHTLRTVATSQCSGLQAESELVRFATFSNRPRSPFVRLPSWCRSSAAANRCLQSVQLSRARVDLGVKFLEFRFRQLVSRWWFQGNTPEGQGYVA